MNCAIYKLLKTQRMKLLKNALVALVSLLGLQSVQAHCLWIETASTGQKDKKQAITVFYGEFGEGQSDALSEWYSDVPQLKIWLVAPDGQKVQLQAQKTDRHIKSDFTPSQEGVYTVVLSHEAKDLGGETKYHFIASTYIAVGQNAQALAKDNKSDLKITPSTAGTFKKSQIVQLTATYQGKALADQKMEIATPSGKIEKLKTDAQGQVSFTAEESGKYNSQIEYYEETPGTHYDAPYSNFWIVSTNSIEVK